MNDAKNRPLQVGDQVLIPARITSLGGTNAKVVCNIETAFKRPGDGQPDSISFLSTAAVLRANEGDENDLKAPFAQ